MAVATISSPPVPLQEGAPPSAGPARRAEGAPGKRRAEGAPGKRRAEGAPGKRRAEGAPGNHTGGPEADLAAAEDQHRRFTAEAVPLMPQLYPAALRLTRHHQDAEDLLQETFARAYLKFHQFAPDTNLRAWLYRILVTTFYSSCRKRARLPAEVPATLLGDAAEGGLAHCWAGSLPRSAEAEAIDNLASSAVMTALADLPEYFKTAVYLADVHGYQCSEIARITDVPLGTVMSRLHRGRQMLRAKIRGRRQSQAVNGTPLSDHAEVRTLPGPTRPAPHAGAALPADLCPARAA
jgi:RNA polymerase sigma-70 factor, ECF subfamily